MRPYPTPTDEDLLVSDHPEAFGEFYDRHVRALLGSFARRTGNAEVAADLAAETFASALVARQRFRPGGPPATAWLYTIASRRLADFHRRGRVDERVRRSLHMERRALSAEDARTIMLLADDTAGILLAGLPDEQRDAITSRHLVQGAAQRGPAHRPRHRARHGARRDRRSAAGGARPRGTGPRRGHRAGARAGHPRLTGRTRLQGWIVSPAASIATNFSIRRARVSGFFAVCTRCRIAYRF